MATATMPMRSLVTVSLVVMLVLGVGIGYVVSDATGTDMPMQMMSGMDTGEMGEHMEDMSSRMDGMGMGRGSIMGSQGGPAKDMPPMHGHD
jgi:hypothetical protein